MKKKFTDDKMYNHVAFVGGVEVRHARWLETKGEYPGLKSAFVVEFFNISTPGMPSASLRTSASPNQLRQLAKQMLAAADEFEAHQAEIMEFELAREA